MRLVHIPVDIVNAEGKTQAKGVVTDKKHVVVGDSEFTNKELIALGLWVRHAKHDGAREFECWINWYIQDNLCVPFAFVSKLSADYHRSRLEFSPHFAHQVQLSNKAIRVEPTNDLTNTTGK